MEMFALIKDVNGTRIVKSSDIQEKADFIIKNRLNDFFDDLIVRKGEDSTVTLDDVHLFESYGGPFSGYIADNILRKSISKKRNFEIKKILQNVFNEFNIDTKLISRINSNYNLFSYFHCDKMGNVCFDLYEVENSLNKLFGELISEQLIEELKRQLSIYDYNIEYNVLEFKNFILSSENIININRNSFEDLLYELGEIKNPKTPTPIRHKCYNCDNLSPLLCKKAEANKKTIDDYSFINEGYQIFITTNYKDLDMVSFIVEDCNDYKAYNDNSIDEEEYSYVKRMRK